MNGLSRNWLLKIEDHWESGVLEDLPVTGSALDKLFSSSQRQHDAFYFCFARKLFANGFDRYGDRTRLYNNSKLGKIQNSCSRGKINFFEDSLK